MGGRTAKHWWSVVPVVLAVPVAAAATLTVTGGALGSGRGTPAACLSAPTVVQNVGTASPNTTNVVSVDVSGIVAACGGGTVRVAVNNNANPVQEATTAIPAGGGSVNVPLATAVPLREAHLVAVTVQGP